ncbi:MAG: hypothetical protein ACE5H9_12310 [Anaerolineae bacterium]
MDPRDIVDQSKNWLESIAEKLPVYKDYKQKEERRQADLILREHLAGQFEAEWRRINDLKSQMLTGPAMMLLDDIGQASRRLQTLIDKIKGAAQGYAGFFDAAKVQEQELDALYEFDYNLLLQADQLAEAVGAVQTALDSGVDSDVAPAVRRLTRVVTDLNRTFAGRRDVMLGVSQEQ